MLMGNCWQRTLGLCSILLLFVASLFGSPQRSNPPYEKEDDQRWVAGNDSLEIAISKKTGTIERLVDKVSQEDYCNQTISSFGFNDDTSPPKGFRLGHRQAGLTILDELRGTQFSDLTQQPAVTNFQATSGPGFTSLSFEKRYPGAEFVALESFRVEADHVRWDVRIRKTQGPDRTLRIVQFAPLPLGDYHGWAPIADAPFTVQPYTPFSIEYGQSIAGPVGEERWRTNIPLVVFYSLRNQRSLSFTVPFEIPSVRVRFLNNAGAAEDFHWNSRSYPVRELPYLQVVSEYLGLRNGGDVQTSVLICAQTGDWRPALGWVYSKYRRYFDPEPGFERWDGAFAAGYELMKDSYRQDELRAIYDGRRRRGVRWEELHGHFPWYGLMIPELGVTSWSCESHPVPGTTLTREKIAAHTRLTREFGIGTFLYFNLTEAEHWYAERNFPDSIARDELGYPIGAFRGEQYPDKRACWLMNADPASSFGRYMARQAEEMVRAYPEAAGFFWDVYGRSYLFDFAHDDGITMVNNKPAYYPEFMFQRMMREHVGPLLHAHGMFVTANKPVSIASCRGLDGIMAMEEASEEENPGWIAAQSYLGLARHVMISEPNGLKAELMFLDCLRYGMLPSDPGTVDGGGRRLTTAQNDEIAKMAAKYQPFLERLRGKHWIFYPRALELPPYVDGNIFRLSDGSVMITLVSTWRYLRHAEGFVRNLEVVCRLPDAAALKHVYAASIDLGTHLPLEADREGNTLRIRVPQHGKATVILLSTHLETSLDHAQ
jgi:hypothetical protein